MYYRNYYMRGATLVEYNRSLGLKNYNDVFPDSFEPVGFNPFEFWESMPERKRLKIYHDGSHYVGHEVTSGYKLSKPRVRNVSFLDPIFDQIFLMAQRQNIHKKALFYFIRDEMLNCYDLDNTEELSLYISRKIKAKFHNLYARIKLFRRKAYMNKWNYFITLTYDDKKETEESFRKGVKKTLANFAFRRGWRYMGVFERAPETNRLHFHGIFYIPDDEMVGELKTVWEYSKRKKKMQQRTLNTFFEERFGVSEFDELSNLSGAIDYLLKYITKTGERVIYSRDLPSEIILLVKSCDICSKYFDFVQKYVLFDDVIDWERDVYKNTA